MDDLTSTLTERGQISLPASLRKAMGLKTGQRLRWQPISATEVRVVVDSSAPAGPLAALGLGPKLGGTPARPTKAWMKDLREDDFDREFRRKPKGTDNTQPDGFLPLVSEAGCTRTVI